MIRVNLSKATFLILGISWSLMFAKTVSGEIPPKLVSAIAFLYLAIDNLVMFLNSKEKKRNSILKVGE